MIDPTTTQLDPTIVNLTKAIRQTETGGDFHASGKSGEYGAYQFTEPTWVGLSKKYGINTSLRDATPDQQNEAAYKQIAEWKSQGKNVGQIASMWNAGEGEPDAYTGTFRSGKAATGVNSYGVHYDVPSYARSVATAYQKLKTGGNVSADPNNPSSTANTTPTETPTGGPDTYGASFQASENDNPLQAGLKSLGNVPSSLLNLGKSLFSAISHPINTIKGIGNAFAGGIEEGYNALVGEEGAHNTQTETFDALKGALNDRYGSLKNAQRTATNDPIGFGADVFSILEGGAGILGKTEELGNLVSKVGGPVVDVGEKVLTAPAKLGAKVLGQSTGVGSEAVKTAFNAGAEGGEANQAFTEALRGNTTPEDLVDKARGALGEVVDTRRANYKEMLGSLKSDTSTIDTSSLKTQLDKSLDSFNITRGEDGKLDFSESTMVNPSDQSKVEAITKDIENWKNNTPEGIDTLKQRLSNYYEPGSRIGAFSEGLRSTARNLIEKTPGYSDAMKNYSEMSDTIKDIKQSLSLGDKAAVETSFNKLKNSLKNDKQFRMAVIDELDKATGGTLRQSIAGQGMSKLAPSGLAKYADIGGGAAALSHGIPILPILGLAITTSPRIVGEIVRALGLGARGTKFVMSYLNKFAAPTVIAGAAASK